MSEENNNSEVGGIAADRDEQEFLLETYKKALDI